MKMPRYASQKARVPQITAARNTAAVSGGMAEFGKGLMAAVDSYANMTTQIDAQLRQVHFDNVVKLNSVKAEGDTLIKSQSYALNNNYGSAGGWEKDYTKFVEKQRKEFQKTMNKQEFAAFEPSLVAQETNGLLKVRQHARDATIKHSTYILGQATATFEARVESSETINDVMSAFANYTGTGSAGQLNERMVPVIGADSYLKATIQSQNLVENKLMFLQAGGAGKIQSPSGATETDWATIHKNLSNPDFKIMQMPNFIDENGLKRFGKDDPNDSLKSAIFTVDDKQRKDMIADARTNMVNQMSLHAALRTENGRKEHAALSEEIVAISLGQGKDEKGKLIETTTLAKRISNNQNITDTQKKELAGFLITTNSNLAAAAKNGLKSYETPQALKFKAIATVLVNSGNIDTEAELQIINNGVMNGLIKPEDGTTLIKNARENMKTVDDRKQKLLAPALKTLAKELGQPPDAFMSLISSMSQGYGSYNAGNRENAMATLMASLDEDNVSEVTYTAINQFLIAVGEGEKKGFTFESMLVDKKSPNYLVEKFIDTYQASAREAKATQTTIAANNYLGLAQKGNQDFVFDVNAYIAGGQANSTNFSVPVRTTGESVMDYLTRVQGLMAKRSILPSTYSAGNVGGVDASSLLIIPTD